SRCLKDRGRPPAGEEGGNPSVSTRLARAPERPETSLAEAEGRMSSRRSGVGPLASGPRALDGGIERIGPALPAGPGSIHQLAFFMPGILPSWASWRSMIREMPNFR